MNSHKNTADSCKPLANARGSEMLNPSRDREGAFVKPRWWTPRTLSQKLVLYFVAAVCALLIATLGVAYDTGRRLLAEQIRAEAMKQVQSTALTMDSYVDRVAVLVRAIAAQQEAAGSEAAPNVISTFSHLLDTIAPEEAFGVYLAFEGPGGRIRSMPWVDRKSQPKRVSPAEGGRDASMEWYQGTRTSGKLHVSEPFFDSDGSKTLLVSVTKPFFGADGRVLGVAGADLSLDLIQAIAGQLRFRPGQKTAGEYAFLISRAGRILSHPDVKSTQADVELVAGGAEGSAVGNRDGSKRYLYWSTAPLTGWKVALNIPESVIVAPVRRLAIRTAGVAAVSLVGLVVLVMGVARRVIGPVRRLTRVTAEVATSNYQRVDELAMSANRDDELGQLARGFQTMVHEVATRESRLKQAEEELIRSEMYFRSLIENTSDVVAIFDSEGVVTYASPSCTRVLGVPPDRYVGADRFAFLHPDDRNAARIEMPRLLEKIEALLSRPSDTCARGGS